MKKTYFLILCLFAILLTGCKKNEFDINATFKDSGTAHSILLVYHASDAKKGWFVRFDAPIIESGIVAKGYTHDPTVVRVYSAGGLEQTWFLADRGEKITISGPFKSPLLWDIGGNEVNKLLSKWRSENESMLKNAPASAINAAIKKFVKQNPDSPASALLLLNTFDRRLDFELFSSLWKSLSDKAQPEVMLKASAIDPEDIKVHKSRSIKDIILYTTADTLQTFKTSDRKATILAFLHGDEPHRAAIPEFLKNMVSDDVRVIHVSFAKNVSFWRHSIPEDAEKSQIEYAWAQGGPTASSMKDFRIGYTPWYIAIDRSGRQIYSGPDSTQVRAKIKKLK